MYFSLFSAVRSGNRQGLPPPPVTAVYNTKRQVAPSSVDHDVATITMMTSGLQVTDQSGALTLRSNVIGPQAYILPTVIQNSILKKTILDPQTNPQRYDLPCHTILDLEKVTPTVDRIQPVMDPSRTPGQPAARIETMPYLVNIRHKKMKKHKLKKFRKRMIFLHRKLNEIKKKKKEKVIVAMERSFATSAQEFNAEEYIENHIKEAKRGSWKIDVIEQWKSSKQAQNTENKS